MESEGEGPLPGGGYDRRVDLSLSHGERVGVDFFSM
jgi:hypothetical protein